MKIYVLVSAVMVTSFIFLAAVLLSPYKSILLPVNIPVGLEFESVQMAPAVPVGKENTYEVVLYSPDGKDLIILAPEEARSALQITAADLGHKGKLVWGDSNNLNLSAAPDADFRSLRVNLNGPLASNGNGFTSLKVVGTESALNGVVRMDSGSKIVVEDFQWSLAGSTIPIAGGEAETGSWIVTASSGSLPSMTIDDEQKITITYPSQFTAPTLYARDLSSGQVTSIPFETTVRASVTPPLSELSSYINSQIYLQAFGWLAPIAALMAIIWVDDRYRRRIRRAADAEALV